MARPHICFIQAQMLPWQAGLYGGARPQVQSKTLSKDDTDGSATLVVRYPRGFESRAPEHLLAHEEFLVLDGWIEINGRRYGTHSYGFLPAGYPRERTRAPDGAVLLTMFYGEPLPGVGAGGDYDPRLLVEYVDPLAMEWDPGLVDPQLARGVAIKPLRTDP